MKITKVSTEQYYRYIPIKGLNSVEEALNIFAKGITRSSRAAELHDITAISESLGGSAVAFYTIGMQHVTGSSFVKDEIITPARRALEIQDSWTRSFDYDGLGSFRKTHVDIKLLVRGSNLYGGEIYSVGLYAAYVADKPEQGLAEYLGVDRTLIWASVEVETERYQASGFEFDFEAIIRRLDSVLGTVWLSGERVAQAMLSVTTYGSSNPSFELYRDAIFTVTIRPGEVAKRFDYGVHNRQGKPKDTWFVKGSVLRGSQSESYKEEGKLAPPTFVIELRSAHKDWLDQSMPIWLQSHKSEALELRDRIANAFR